MNVVQGEGYSLHEGDCLEVMAGLDRPVDAIIADLPYGTTACEWDSVIPLAPMWVQFKRLIRPNGAIVLFCSQPFTSALIMSNRKWFKYTWVWNKRFTASFALCNKRPMKTHDDIAVFGEGQIRYNPQMIKRQQPITLGGKNKSITAPLASPLPEHKIYFDKYPESILTYSCRNENGNHPTQKPVDLLAYLIRTYTNPGETVLDCTMGSGTTIVAAIQEGRQGIGIELDSGYFDISVKRCADASRAARGLPKQLRDDASHTDLPLFMGLSV